MNTISCKCLNITIETEVTKFPIVRKELLDLTIEESEDIFFQNEILRQLEKLDSINKSLPGLVETREVGSWIIHYCINCKVQTHAVHKEKGASCVLVNSNLLTSDAINKLRNSENFSKLYGIVIQSVEVNDEYEDTFYPSGVESIVRGLKQILTENMRKEAALVEERIKKFSEEQYNRLDHLREKLFSEEEMLIRTVVSHISTKQSQGEQRQQDGTSAISSRSPFKSRESSERRSSQPSSISQLRHTPKRQKSTPVYFDQDAEILFALDDVESNPQSNDDEIDSDSDDTSNAKVSERYQSRTRINTSKFAKSLPMDIPNFMRPKKDADQDAEDDEPEDEDNVDIAASIKKLAKSVHGGGIFGDLPRPRFSTQL
ncbi:hypothetical protein WA026_004063 [Henosepilachna vigintioctopunctata]|uniref:Uncharacterized protein n=1 Tax=Henosepilachna vigintioctopunctata TaxID=420089 RepID=A0AAW1U9A8_9CUCU